jgi:hypothetical protein
MPNPAFTCRALHDRVPRGSNDGGDEQYRARSHEPAGEIRIVASRRRMKAVVIGAGVVGVTTAYELYKDGHEVTVVERHAGAADETSFGNAGLIARCAVAPRPARPVRRPRRRRRPRPSTVSGCLIVAP